MNLWKTGALLLGGDFELWVNLGKLGFWHIFRYFLLELVVLAVEGVRLVWFFIALIFHLWLALFFVIKGFALFWFPIFSSITWPIWIFWVVRLQSEPSGVPFQSRRFWHICLFRIKAISRCHHLLLFTRLRVLLRDSAVELLIWIVDRTSISFTLITSIERIPISWRFNDARWWKFGKILVFEA